MSFLIDLSDEQRMILETLSRAAQEAGDFDLRRRRLRADPPDRMALWKPMVELGILGACFGEESGGLGGAPRDMATLPAALGPSLPVEPFVTCGVTSARLLLAASAEELIGQLIEGVVVAVPALAETAYPFLPPKLPATESGGVWSVSGVKPAVRHGDVATHLILSAAATDGEIMLLVCDAQDPTVERSRFRLIDDAGAADIHFAQTEATLLLKGKAALAALTDAADWTLAALAVETAAICERLNRDTFGYLAERRQFGQPLARFQALQFKAADMATAAAEAAAIADAALIALAAPPSDDRTRRLLSASVSADRVGRICAHEAVQMHGGMGVSDELSISHHARRLAAIRSQMGTTAARAARIEDLTEGLAR